MISNSILMFSEYTETYDILDHQGLLKFKMGNNFWTSKCTYGNVFLPFDIVFQEKMDRADYIHLEKYIFRRKILIILFLEWVQW